MVTTRERCKPPPPPPEPPKRTSGRARKSVETFTVAVAAAAAPKTAKHKLKFTAAAAAKVRNTVQPKRSPFRRTIAYCITLVTHKLFLSFRNLLHRAMVVRLAQTRNKTATANAPLHPNSSPTPKPTSKSGFKTPPSKTFTPRTRNGAPRGPAPPRATLSPFPVRSSARPSTSAPPMPCRNSKSASCPGTEGGSVGPVS